MYKFTSLLLLLLLSGCATYGVIDNTALDPELDSEQNSYSWQNARGSGKGEYEDIVILLSFSGGGTRAAALSYGVLKSLRDTTIKLDGKTVRLLDEVDYISSVSGGSFTSAYYGLYGDAIFETYEDAFLTRDVEGYLFWGLFNPFEWFKAGGRTEMAIDYYNKHIFHDATFADMKRDDSPFILINASDLGHGLRFSFIQDYFNLLCSDIDTFPVAKAVAASSAVPILFHPVVVENFDDCGSDIPEWLITAQEKNMEIQDPQMELTLNNIESFLGKEQRKYVHLVDGGITDNLGLLALYDMVSLSGGGKATVRKLGKEKPPTRIIIISVNSSTDPDPAMDITRESPSIGDTINAMSDVQLHRYNASTLQLIGKTMQAWADELSTPEHQVKTSFIRVGARNIKEPERRVFFNTIPTSFALSQETIDELILLGHDLLQNDSEYQKLISDLDGQYEPKN